MDFGVFVVIAAIIAGVGGFLWWKARQSKPVVNQPKPRPTPPPNPTPPTPPPDTPPTTPAA